MEEGYLISRMLGAIYVSRRMKRLLVRLIGSTKRISKNWF